MPHALYIAFLFALGACVGSFLNVVVWRLPRNESVVSPPSHCPKCNKLLAWYDNVPVIGWLKLRGKCRWCGLPISARYPTIELLTGLLFVFYYVMFFILQIGPCSPAAMGAGGAAENPFFLRRPLDVTQDWPIFGLYLFTLSVLLAASLIDAELFIIPLSLCYVLAVVAFPVHALAGTPLTPGALNASLVTGALALGGAIGLGVSLLLWWRGLFPTSFPQGEPLLDVDREMVAKEIEEARRKGEDPPPLPPPYTPGGIRLEMAKEMLFLTPPVLGAAVALAVTQFVPAVGGAGGGWRDLLASHVVSGLLGSVFGALVGAFTIWFTRIAFTLLFGRVAMGLGDVHLMFGIGAVVGAGASVVVFFIAPFFGLLLHLYFYLSRSQRELPYGPYLSLATAVVMLIYCPIHAALQPGLEGLVIVLHQMFS